MRVIFADSVAMAEINSDENFHLQRAILLTIGKIGTHFNLKAIEYNKLISPNTLSEHSFTIHDVQKLLIGFHIISSKLGKKFTENRHLVRIGFKNLGVLSKLESEFELTRIDDQVGNNTETVTYTVGENNLNALRVKIDQPGEFNILYFDPTPGIQINHHFLPITKWPESEDYEEIEKYILQGLRKYYLSKIKHPIHHNYKEEMSMMGLEKVLLERILFLLSTYRWGLKHLKIRDLLMLNSFHFLAFRSLTPEQLVLNLEELILELDLHLEDYAQPFAQIKDLYTQYNKWDDIYDSNPDKLKEEVGKTKLNRIIYSKKYGFCKLLSCSSTKLLNLYSPLAMHEPKINDTGFYEVFLGQKVAFFN
jgi:hypothetical protein